MLDPIRLGFIFVLQIYRRIGFIFRGLELGFDPQKEPSTNEKARLGLENLDALRRVASQFAKPFVKANSRKSQRTFIH